MLKIENVSRIVGMHVNGRVIIGAGDYIDSLRKTGKDYFVFRIERQNGYSGYDREHQIVLSRAKNVNGRYDMFNMGLQLSTQVEVDVDQIRKATDLASSIRNVLVKTQTYYQQNS